LASSLAGSVVRLIRFAGVVGRVVGEFICEFDGRVNVGDG
jgi:hypothetical protein